MKKWCYLIYILLFSYVLVDLSIFVEGGFKYSLIVMMVTLPIVTLMWVFSSRDNNHFNFTLIALILVCSIYAYFYLDKSLEHMFPPMVLIMFKWPSLLLACGSLMIHFKKPKRIKFFPDKKVGAILYSLALVFFTYMSVKDLPDKLLVNTKEYTNTAVELEFPLVEGKFYIKGGSSAEHINRHASLEAQKHAMDIVELNKGNQFQTGFLPSDLSKHKIYENDVVSPCDGEIIGAANDVKDIAAFYMDIRPILDREKKLKSIAGNHVLIYCKAHTVLLAHFKKNSLRVKRGQFVKTGDLLGQIGNSGNTSQPHLHIHAMPGRVTQVEEVIFKSDGTPILFNGKFLITGDIYEN